MHTARVNCIDWSPDSSRICSVGVDSLVAVLNPSTINKSVKYPRKVTRSCFNFFKCRCASHFQLNIAYVHRSSCHITHYALLVAGQRNVVYWRLRQQHQVVEVDQLKTCPPLTPRKTLGLDSANAVGLAIERETGFTASLPLLVFALFCTFSFGNEMFWSF